MANCNYKVNIKDIQSKYSFKIFCSSDNAEIQAEIGNLEDLNTTAKNNLVSAINEVHSDTETNATAISGLQSSKEDKSNKVTSFSSTSTDTQYPSAKAVYDSQVTQDETISTLETNLEETKEELDYYKTIYNVLPKATDTGESITLNNTGESILKLDLKGNTSQYTTTGKNLFMPIPTQTYHNVVFTKNDDGSYTLNGVCNGSGNILIENQTLEAGYYSMQCKYEGTLPNDTNSRCQVWVQSQNYGLNINNSDGNTLVVSRELVSDATDVNFRIRVENGFNYQNVKLYPMLVKGTYTSETIGDFEPYTGGQPSPSPDFPQQIHEVSGDNEVLVRNIQLWDEELEDGGYNLITGKKISNNYHRSANYIPITPNSAMEFMKPVGKYTRVLFYDKNKNFLDAPDIIYTNYNYTAFTSPNNAYYMTFLIDSYSTFNNDLMIYYGTTSKDYVAYNGDTYELDLGVENLFDKTTQLYEGYIGGTGVYSYSTSSVRSFVLKVQPNTTYTISKLETKVMRIVKCNGTLENNATYTLFLNVGTNTKTTFTTPNDCEYIGAFFYDNGETYTLQEVLDSMQIEEGTKANSYSPFGQAPIKMRGIGTYEDYFVRNSGKNKVEGHINGYAIGSNGRFASNSDYDMHIAQVIQGKTYTVTTNEAQLVAGFFTELPTINSTSYNGSRIVQNEKTFIAPITGYIAFRSSSSYQFAQLELGTSSTTYEPYGTGQWCKYNAIGKVVYVGTESNWYKQDAWSAVGNNTSAFYRAKPSDSVGDTNTYSNYFIRNTSITSVDTPCMNLGGTNIIFRINKSLADTTDAFKTWLSTHNTSVYYQLETPYLSLIENETLISQLDKVEKALGKDGQTNISQINNDAPFKIYASALKEIE